MNRIMEQLSQSMGRMPTINELADAMEIEPKALSLLMKQSYTVTSLNMGASNNNDNTILDIIADETEPVDTASIDQLYGYMDAYLDQMTRYVIEARMSGKVIAWKTLEQRTGLSRWRLQETYRRGMNRLRMLMSNPLAGTPLGTDNNATE